MYAYCQRSDQKRIYFKKLLHKLLFNKIYVQPAGQKDIEKRVCVYRIAWEMGIGKDLNSATLSQQERITAEREGAWAWDKV